MPFCLSKQSPERNGRTEVKFKSTANVSELQRSMAKEHVSRIRALQEANWTIELVESRPRATPSVVTRSIFERDYACDAVGS